MKAFFNTVSSRSTFGGKIFCWKVHNFFIVILSEKRSDFWRKIFGHVFKIAFYVPRGIFRAKIFLFLWKSYSFINIFGLRKIFGILAKKFQQGCRNCIRGVQRNISRFSKLFPNRERKRPTSFNMNGIGNYHNFTGNGNWHHEIDTLLERGYRFGIFLKFAELWTLQRRKRCFWY